MKKSLRVLAALLLMMILLCSTASAAGVSEACLNERQENYLRVQARVSAANAKVRALVLHAQLTPYDDVDWAARAGGAYKRACHRIWSQPWLRSTVHLPLVLDRWPLGGCGSAEGDQRSAVRLRPSH